MRAFVVTVVLIAVGLIAVPSAVAAPGELDPTFGAGGVVNVPAPFATGWSLAQQPDGKTLVGGRSGRDFVVCRLLTDGTPDASYGTAGCAEARFTDLYQEGGSVALDAAGRVLLAGSAYVEGAGYNLAIARFTTDGVLDSSFGSGGKVMLDFGNSNDRAHAIAVGADGSIVVAGETVQYPPGLSKSLLVVRLADDGALDASFDGDGFVISNFAANPAFYNGDDDIGWSLVLSSRAVSVGGVVAGGAAVVRYHDNGSLDGTFGAEGVASTGLVDGWRFEALDLVADEAGRLVLAGGAGFGAGIARFTSSGQLDPSLGGDGTVILDGGPFSVGWAIASQVNGRLVVAGWGWSGPYLRLVVARVESDGSLDAGFGSGGYATLSSPSGYDLFGYDVLVQRDGRIVAAGGNPGMVVARFEGDLVDLEPPALATPGTVAWDATGPTGATVPYTVTATDNVDPSPVVSCAPASGSTFPIGGTTVSCTATDNAGNSSQGSFVVHVRGAREQLANLIVFLDSLPLEGKLGTSLRDKLVTAQRFLAAGKPKQAKETLASFLAEVDSQDGKNLTTWQAQKMRYAATRTVAVIGG